MPIIPQFAGGVLDVLRRPMHSLRVSVTDRCNLRCQYCMPEDEYVWLNREAILRFEEISELVSIFTTLGVQKIRLTGGEPLLRHGLSSLVRTLAGNTAIHDLALTTNGILLAREARALQEAGLMRVTVSLDTLQPARFRSLTRSSAHGAVFEGIEAAREAGLGEIKINAVIMRDFNDDELPALIEYGRCVGAEVRFIEYMDVGGATRWSSNRVVPRAEMIGILKRRFGLIEPVEAGTDGPTSSRAPADRFRLPDGTVFGIISSTTEPFCRTCDRSRLTTDGIWFLCLYALSGIDLKKLLREGTPGHLIAQTLVNAWTARRDRGAEERTELPSRGILFPVEELRQDPHREMHARGG
ncbi:MAG: GTP 3',8-cyclase MoaA [Terriglobia bacterium]